MSAVSNVVMPAFSNAAKSATAALPAVLSVFRSPRCPPESCQLRPGAPRQSLRERARSFGQVSHTHQPFTTCDTSSPGASRPRPTLASAAAAASAGGGAIPGSQSAGTVAADSTGGAPSSTPRREQPPPARTPAGRRGGSIVRRTPGPSDPRAWGLVDLPLACTPLQLQFLQPARPPAHLVLSTTQNLFWRSG